MEKVKKIRLKWKNWPENSRYFISENGDVFDREKDRFLTPHVTGGNPFSGKQYKRVLLKKVNGEFVYKYIHQLVAILFLPNEYFQGSVVNHINGDPTDNNYRNLEFVTQAANIRKGNHAEKYNKTLSEKAILEIRNLYDEENMNALSISKLKGIPYITVFRICTRKTYVN